jgi:hypothetical protein
MTNSFRVFKLWKFSLSCTVFYSVSLLSTLVFKYCPQEALLKHLQRCFSAWNIKFNTNKKDKLELQLFRCLEFTMYIFTLWPKFANKLYRLSDRRLSAKLVPNFVERRYRMVSATDLYCYILGVLDRSRNFFFQVAPQLYSWGWVNPVPDPLLFRKIW